MKKIFLQAQLLFIFLISNLFLFSKCNIIFSKDSGFYPEEFLLTLSSSEKNSKIYYTIDGTNPTNLTSAKEYKEPILIKDRSKEPNYLSNYEEDSNSQLSISLNANYKKPNFLVDKSMIIRAVLKNENGFGKIYDKTYFITTDDLIKYEDYTVISLVTNPENFFSADIGIYVTGSSFIPNENNICINGCNFINRGKEWEREASITIFEKGEISIEENAGIRIKGASTRGYPQKSFNIFFRKKYGKNKIISDNLFPRNIDINGNTINRYDSFSLKAISDDKSVRDKFANKLICDRKLLATPTDMKAAALFLNGEFWGLYLINEKLDEKFCQNHYNIPKEDIIFMKNYKMESGTNGDLENLLNFMSLYSEKDLTDIKNYNDVCDIIDIDSLIEHYAAGIFLGTVDWPNLNFGMWRNNGTKIDNNIYSDGKWRFLTFDLDFSIIYDYEQYITDEEGFKYNKFESLTDPEGFGSYPPTSLFLALLKNEEFRTKFERIYEEYANEVMTMDRVEPILEEYEEIGDLYSLSIARWNSQNISKIENIQNNKSYFKNKILPQIKKFFENRAEVTLEHMRKFLKEFE